MKLLRILVTLKGLSAMFWNIARFINQSTVCLFQAPGDYTYFKDSPPKISSEFYIKGTLSLSHQTFSVVLIIFYWLLAIKKTSVVELLTFLLFLNNLILKGNNLNSI